MWRRAGQTEEGQAARLLESLVRWELLGNHAEQALRVKEASGIGWGVVIETGFRFALERADRTGDVLGRSAAELVQAVSDSASPGANNKMAAAWRYVSAFAVGALKNDRQAADKALAVPLPGPLQVLMAQVALIGFLKELACRQRGTDVDDAALLPIMAD